MRFCLLTILTAGALLGNVDILIPEAGQVPIVTWSHNGTPQLMYCQEPQQPVILEGSSQDIFLSLHEGSDSDPVLLAVSGDRQYFNFSTEFEVLDLPGLTSSASRSLTSDDLDPPVYCSWHALPILPRYADCMEDRRMVMVMNTGYADNPVQDETWMTTVSVNPWSSSVVNTADTTGWRQSFFSSSCIPAGQNPPGSLPGFTMASGSRDGYPAQSFYGVITIYLVSDMLHEDWVFMLEAGSEPVAPPGILASGYGQNCQLSLWTDTTGTVWCSSFTSSVTEPETAPLETAHGELPFAAAMTRTREDEGILLVWYDGSKVMARHWLGEWNGYAHAVEPWAHVSPGNIAVCSDTGGYWVAWKDDASAVPEYRFLDRDDLTGIGNRHAVWEFSSGLSIYENPVAVATSYSVSLPPQEPYSIFIFDISGRNLGELASGTGMQSDGTLNLSRFPPGVYCLVLKTDQGVYRVPVLKMDN